MRQRARASTIRASEIGSFQFCRRAWGYRRSGQDSQNLEEMHSGTRLHEAHSRALFSATLFRLAGSLALLAALVMLAIYLVDRLL